MKLVEAESTGPVEGEDAVVLAPRPPHRRVSVSLLFTLTVLVGTVVAIYTLFPARHNELVSSAIAAHRSPPSWDLASPSPSAFSAFLLGAAGKDAPQPPPGAVVIGARHVTVLDHGAALIRLHIGADDVTLLIQHSRGISPDTAERTDGDLRALMWHRGPFLVVAVGPDASSAAWRTSFH
ncbi:MAG TPA: hypothetical protein VGM88_34540 [Kofleriaceae bacterium]|jgi:hypothetical protein